MKTPKQKIDEVLDRLGISGIKASSMMNIPHSTFRKNMMDTSKTYKFTDKNYSDLVDYLIDEIKLLVFEKKESKIKVDAVQLVKDELDNICNNYKSLSKQEGWNFTEEINKIIDYMEEPDAFLDMKVYASIIDTIEDKTKRNKQPFEVDTYTNYAHSDKDVKHDRWYEYLAYRRQQRLMDILN